MNPITILQTKELRNGMIVQPSGVSFKKRWRWWEKLFLKKKKIK